MTVDDQAQATMFELTVEQSTTATSVSGIKKKRAQKVRQHNLSEADLTTPKPRSTRKRKDKSVRALYREKLASLNIEALKRPWMATKSFRLIDTDEDLATWVDEVLADKSRWVKPYANSPEPCPVVAVDTETTGLDTRVLVHKEEVRNQDGSFKLDAQGHHVWEFTYEVKIDTSGVCLSVDGVSGIYIPVSHENRRNVSREAVRYHLQRLFNVSHLAFYHAKFDREVMRCTLGIVFRDYPHFEDVQVLHYINDPKAKLDEDKGGFSQAGGGLKELSKEHLGFDQIELGTIGKVSADWCPVTGSGYCNCTDDERRLRTHGTRMQYVPFGWIPTEIAVWYAASDAICTWLLWDKFRAEAQGRVRVHKIDGELIDSLTWFERQRFKIAEEPYQRLRRWHLKAMIDRRANLRRLANEAGWRELTDDQGKVMPDTQFDVDKKHLPELLFNIMKLEVVKKSEKTGAPSVDKEAMQELLKRYPDNAFLKALQDYKQYVALHPENLKYDPKDHSARIYLKQCVVAGGRLAASGGKFDRDGGFGLNAQAIKKVGGNKFVKGRVLDPDYVLPENVDPYEEKDLHPSCFQDVEVSTLSGWLQKTPVNHGKSIEFVEEMFGAQFPEDVDDESSVTDEWGDVTTTAKYAPDAPERKRTPVYTKREERRQVPGIIKNHIANFLGYSICLVPKCTSCAKKHGILIEDGKLDANQILNLRALFVAEEGWTYFSSDYSNIEMRCAANESKEPVFLKEFLEGAGDFHALTASAVFPEFNDPHCSKALRKLYRDLAKIMNFALLYGGTAFTIKKNLSKKKPDITMKQAEKYVNDYWASVPVFYAWCQDLQRIAREDMTCTTATGRIVKFESAMKAERVRVPTPLEEQEYRNYWKLRKRQEEAVAEGDVELAATLQQTIDAAYADPETGIRNTRDYKKFMGKIQRVAVNVPLQGLAGDLMRMAINRVRKWAAQLDPLVQSILRMHGSVHDELDYCVKNPYVPFVVPRITRLMKLRTLHALRKWPVPIECDTEYGFSWDIDHHVTGDTDHIPAAWTRIKGLEEYLPEDCSPETLDHLVAALASGKESAREAALAWAKDSLHENAASAFWHAAYFLDRDKKKQNQTDAATIRKQVIAAVQLHEYWMIDTTPDADDASLETLEEYEQRRGLTEEDRGYMPPGGWLGSLPIEGVMRPELPELGDAPEEEAPAPAPQATLFVMKEEPAYKNHPMVRNIKDNPRGYDVDCMRPGKWGNPFVVGKDGSRDEVIAMHREWLPTQPQLMADLHELKGKRLGCCCAPLPCHCDTLAKMAEKVPYPTAPKMTYPEPQRPAPVKPMVEACNMANDNDLVDELLGKDVVSMHSAKSSGVVEPASDITRIVVLPGEEVVESAQPQELPTISLRTKAVAKKFAMEMGRGMGELSVSFMCAGKPYTWNTCCRPDIPQEFMDLTNG